MTLLSLKTQTIDNKAIKGKGYPKISGFLRPFLPLKLMQHFICFGVNTFQTMLWNHPIPWAGSVGNHWVSLHVNLFAAHSSNVCLWYWVYQNYYLLSRWALFLCWGFRTAISTVWPDLHGRFGKVNWKNKLIMEKIGHVFDTWRPIITAFRADWYSTRSSSERLGFFVGSFSSFLPSSCSWTHLIILHRLDAANALCSAAETKWKSVVCSSP